MNKTNKHFGLLLIWISIFGAVEAEATTPIAGQELLQKIAGEVSGSICFEHIRFLSTLHRIWGSRDYHRAAEYLIEKSKEYGLSEVVIEKYPIETGRESFWMHSTGGYVPWNLKSGEFRLIQPYPMLITHYENAPSTIAPGSRSAEVTAALIYVGRGDSPEDYKAKDVRGKIVLAERGRHDLVHELAVHHFGALGTAQFYNFSGNYLESEGIYWANIKPWSADGKKASTFGINLSTSQGLFLKGLLEKGENVIVTAKIQADIVEGGVFELATAAIPGALKPEEEFIFYAHLDHPKPGAHDNASGDAVLLEIARTLSSLIQKNVIPAPDRTIRFMWIPHMSGLNMYFFHHQDKIGKIKGGCNVDCVGVNQAKFPTRFHVALPPHSLPGVLTDIANNMVDYFNQKSIEESDWLTSPEGSRNLFSATLMPYQGASDEYTANTRSLNIPSIYFFDDPLPPRHNQINFLEYIDRSNLQRISYLGAIISYTFASAGGKTLPNLLNEIGCRGKERLGRELLQAKNFLESSREGDIHQNFARAKNLLDWGAKREGATLESVLDLLSEHDYLKTLYGEAKQRFNTYATDCQNQLSRYYGLKCQALGLTAQKADEKEIDISWKKTIPVLNPDIKGSIGYFSNYLEDRLGEDFLKKYKGLRSSIKYGNVGYYETLNYIDGQNSVADIYKAVQAELWSEGYPIFHSLSLEETTEFFHLLRDAGIIKLLNK